MTAILRGFSRKLLAQTRGVIQTNRVPRARHNSGVKRKSCAVPGGLESLSHATHGSTTPTRATPARVGGPVKPWAIIFRARGARVVPGCPTYRVPQRGTKELSPARPSCADFAQLGVVQRWETGNKNSECRRQGRLPSNSLLPSLRDSARYKRLPRAYLHPITRKIGACCGPRNPPWAKSVSPSGLVCG